jgi:hypothetical protein
MGQFIRDAWVRAQSSVGQLADALAQAFAYVEGVAYVETLETYASDIGTPGSSYVVCPFAGTITGLAVVNHAANAGTKTVLTAKIAGSAVTHPAFEVAITAAAGTGVSVVPTAANVVTAGQVIEIAYDGGSSAVTPATFTISVTRA